MKQINQIPIVQFTFVGEYEFPIEEAEEVIRKPTDAEQMSALLELLKKQHIVDHTIYNHAFAEFKNAVGRALLAKRENELKQLPESTDAI